MTAGAETDRGSTFSNGSALGSVASHSSTVQHHELFAQVLPMENVVHQLDDRVHADQLAHKAQQLGDIELAVLLCLITGEHCIIEADHSDIDKAEQELSSICSNTFGLQNTVIRCSPETTLDEFGAGVLIEDENPVITPIQDRRATEDFFFSSDGARRDGTQERDSLDLNQARVADVVIAKGLHLASSPVQIQALELIRSKRVYTRTAIFTAPKRFLVIGLVTAQEGPHFVPHLNDQFSLSHLYEMHDESGKAHLYHNDNSSTGSILRSQPTTHDLSQRGSEMSYMKPTVTKSDVDYWVSLAAAVKLSPDVRAYLHDIVTFMRMHRAIAGGVTAQATRHLYALSHALAPLHCLDFITPSLVSLATRKVYPHRLAIIKPEDEISLQWGSSLEAVKEYLEGISAEDIIEDVLESVETPL